MSVLIESPYAKARELPTVSVLNGRSRAAQASESSKWGGGQKEFRVHMVSVKAETPKATRIETPKASTGWE